MPKRIKAEPPVPRFKIGDTVRITSKMHTRFDGLTGVVIAVQQSRHARSLDKYTVAFGNDQSSQETFWDIELSRLSN